MRKTLTQLIIWGGVVVSGWLGCGEADAQTWRTMTSARQVWDTEPLNVEVHYGAGTLRISPADAPLLYQMELRYNEEAFEPLVEFDEDDRQLELGVRSIEGSRMNIREGSTATISLSRQVPLDLDLEFGAGKAEIQLGGIPLQRLEISTGASETTIGFDEPNPLQAEVVSIQAGAADLRVTGLGNTRAERIEFEGGVGATVLDFGGAWTRDAMANVEMGIGSLTLRLPRSVGVRVDRSSFLTSFSAADLRRNGDSYFSSNWDSATHKLTINVEAAFGSIDVRWID